MRIKSHPKTGNAGLGSIRSISFFVNAKYPWLLLGASVEGDRLQGDVQISIRGPWLCVESGGLSGMPESGGAGCIRWS